VRISTARLTMSFGATSLGCKVETLSLTAVATTDTRIAPSRLSSKAAPKMMFASGLASALMRVAPFSEFA
jgi:hypothetical protein